jgi:hypothetical protein
MKVFDNIVIDSKNRSSGTTTDFLIDLQEPDLEPNLLEITSIVFPYVFDTVDSTNNSFKIGLTTYTVSTGHYDVNTLIAALNAQITGVGTFSMGYNNKLVLTLLVAATFTPGIANNLLGFTLGPYLANTVFNADQYPNLTEDSDYLTLHSKLLSGYGDEAHFHSDKRSYVLCTIPLTEPFGGIITYQPQQRLVFKISGNKFNRVDFYLRDQGNNAINLGNSTFSINITRYSSLKQ